MSGISNTRLVVDRHVYSDEHHSMAVCGNIVLTYSKQPPNQRYLAAWDQETARLSAQGSGSLAVMTIIEAGTPPPDDASRKHIRETIIKHKQKIAAFAYVVEGRGFGAAAMRSALSIMSLAAHYPFPQKVFATIDEAARWVARTGSPSVVASNIVAAAQRTRSDVRLAAAG